VIVLDTTVLVDEIRGNPVARAALGGIREDGEQPTASVLSKTELLAGHREDEEPALRQLFRAITWIPVDDDIAERAGQFANAFVRSHRSIGTVDFVIAATADVLDARLWTLNIRHFPMFPELHAPY
jgi:predicted nucleic acid-binding protein